MPDGLPLRGAPARICDRVAWRRLDWRGAWLGVAIGQLYLLGRLWIRLVFFAAETALFQGRLAHAGYIAAGRRPSRTTDRRECAVTFMSAGKHR